MPRRAPIGNGEFVYHVLNRAAKRTLLFFREADYAAFEAILLESRARFHMRILAYCLMPNHWHFVLWPTSAKQLSDFMHWLTMTHAHRWQECHHNVGTGAVYQGRFKALPIQTDSHFLNVCRYVERNPLRAGLVGNAEQWQWSSLWRKHHNGHEWLESWPVAPHSNWTNIVNGMEPESDVRAIRKAVKRGSPYGDAEWMQRTALSLGLESTLRLPGRPRKAPGAILERPFSPDA